MFNSLPGKPYKNLTYPKKFEDACESSYMPPISLCTKPQSTWECLPAVLLNNQPLVNKNSPSSIRPIQQRVHGSVVSQCKNGKKNDCGSNHQNQEHLESFPNGVDPKASSRTRRSSSVVSFLKLQVHYYYYSLPCSILDLLNFYLDYGFVVFNFDVA